MSYLVPCGYILMGSKEGRGNQSIQLVKVLHCKLLTSRKQIQAFPHDVSVGM